ncbi:MAG: nucleotide sugar dehydrogenase [Euryarchaeota archaeon]|nr:nucleotide sugar dehydrogenase [Euryarchaeota archaeon]
MNGEYTINRIMKKVVVIGMGYVGIPAAALFADLEGFNVVGLQRRSQRSGWKIDLLNNGKNPIGGEEPGLSELIAKVVEKGTFRVTDDFSECKDADAILIDVQTPTDDEGVPHYESLREVSRQVGKHMKKGALVVIESTVAPGTTTNIVQPLLEEESGLVAGRDFSLVFSYERVMVGRLIKNIVHLPRIVGGIDEESTRRGVDLYKHIVKEQIYPTDSLTAELAKVVENTYRDVNIAFANEVALICESLGVDAFKVRELVNTLPNDPSNPASNPIRDMHFPGAGVGGHCLPKDPWLLKYGVDTYGKFKVEPNVIVKSRELNLWMPTHMADLVEEGLTEAGRQLEGAKIAILGVAFLENSDDTRNTPSKPLYKLLIKKGAKPVLHDPYVRDFDVPFTEDLNAVIEGADAIALVTKHKEYLNLNLNPIKTQMRTPVLVDGRNMYKKEVCEKAGFIYKGVGKPHS